MLGAKIYTVERDEQLEYYEPIETKMSRLASKLDGPSYFIPNGLSTNTIGIWGYVDMFNELISVQNADELFDDICFTTGSGGTLCGKMSNFI